MPRNYREQQGPAKRRIEAAKEALATGYHKNGNPCDPDDNRVKGLSKPKAKHEPYKVGPSVERVLATYKINESRAEEHNKAVHRKYGKQMILTASQIRRDGEHSSRSTAGWAAEDLAVFKFGIAESNESYAICHGIVDISRYKRVANALVQTQRRPACTRRRTALIMYQGRKTLTLMPMPLT